MESAVTQVDPPAVVADRPAWRLAWLTPGRCRLILAAVLLLGFFGHLRYLTHNCPLDLSGDEAHYWDWSRQLDLSYYSKGPLVAYIIRASCAVFGDTMWAIRLPALILACATGVVTYLLTRKLFDSERIALGAVLLNALVPMFIAGSVLMTIDPPFFFCWALATYLLARIMFDGRQSQTVRQARVVWVGIGVAVGIGFLAKYAMFLWLPIMLIALWADRPSRRLLRTPGPWAAVGVAFLFTSPVIVWNARNGWVSLRHVAKQTGTDAADRFAPLNLPEFIGGQLGVLGPTIAVLMAAAVVYAWSQARRDRHDPRSRKMTFLVAIGLPFLTLTALTSLRAKVQPNWPAPAYFTLLILTAYFLATRLTSIDRWKPWRGWFYASAVIGLVATPILHNSDLLYPVARWFQNVRHVKGDLEAGKFDPTARLKEWRTLGDAVTSVRDELGPGTFVMAEDYQAAGELAFYVEGQPKTYYAGSYFTGKKRRRHSQYDLWPDRSLDVARNPALARKNAVYVGFPNDDLLAAFDRVEPIITLVKRHGVVVRTLRYARCYGFKGMEQPAEFESY